MGSEIETTVNANVICEQRYRTRSHTDAEIRNNTTGALNCMIDLG